MFRSHFFHHLLVRIQKLLEEKEFILKHFSQDTLIENLTTLPINNDEKDFIKKVIELIRVNIESENLHSLFIEKELGISNSQLYRKIKQIFNVTPIDLINSDNHTLRSLILSIRIPGTVED